MNNIALDNLRVNNDKRIKIIIKRLNTSIPDIYYEINYGDFNFVSKICDGFGMWKEVVIIDKIDDRLKTEPFIISIYHIEELIDSTAFYISQHISSCFETSDFVWLNLGMTSIKFEVKLGYDTMPIMSTQTSTQLSYTGTEKKIRLSKWKRIKKYFNNYCSI